jgi:hypothetical protein
MTLKNEMRILVFQGGALGAYQAGAYLTGRSLVVSHGWFME